MPNEISIQSNYSLETGVVETYEDPISLCDNQSKLFVNNEGSVCKIRADINAKYPTTCKIYTIHGNLVATIASHAELTNGINEFSYVLPQKGAYLIYMENGNNTNVKKIIVK